MTIQTFNALAGSSAPSYPGQDGSDTPNPIALATYQTALDTHDYGNGSIALTDPSTWGEAAGNVGKFLVSAAYSGYAGFANSFISASNFFTGGDTTPVDVASDLSSLDSDLGAYYKAHKQGADVAGFVVSSFIPGLAGVKLLNVGGKLVRAAAESGQLGDGILGAIGALKPAATFADAAATEFAQSQATFSFINTNVLKSIAVGAGEQALQAAAFETMVNLTMFKSPVLDQQSASDVVHNVLTSAVIGGAIGGVIQTAVTTATAGKAIVFADVGEKQLSLVRGLTTELSASDRIVSAAAELQNKVQVPPTSSVEEQQKLTRLQGQRQETLKNTVNQGILDLAKPSEKPVASQLAALMQAEDPALLIDNFSDATAIGKASSKLPGDVPRGRVAATARVGPPTAYNQYVKLTGEGAGGVSSKEPTMLNLADIVSGGIDSVKIAIAKFGFKAATIWTPLTKLNHLEAEARYYWADNQAVSDNMIVGSYDIPLQERILASWTHDQQQVQALGPLGGASARINAIQVAAADGSKTSYTSLQDFRDNLIRTKTETASTLLRLAKQQQADISIPEIAKITNLRESYLRGAVDPVPSNDLFARQYHQAQYLKLLADKGVKAENAEATNLTLIPSYAKVSYDVGRTNSLSSFELDGAAAITAKQQLVHQAVLNVLAKHIPADLLSRFPTISDALIRAATRLGSSPSTLGSATGPYGSLASYAQQIGSATSALQKQRVDALQEILGPHILALGQDQNAAIEFWGANNLVASTAEQYVLNPDGSQTLLARSIARYQAALAAGEKPAAPVLQAGAPRSIPITSPKAFDALSARIQTNGIRTNGFKDLRAVQGLENNKDPDTFYPIRQNPNDYPHFLFVMDHTIPGQMAGHSSMIHAASERELGLLREKVPAQYSTYTKKQIEERKMAQGVFEYENTLHENYIDADLRRAGMQNQFFPYTDPQKIVNTWLEQESSSERTFARELVSAAYEKPMTELRNLGDIYTQLGTSRYGNASLARSAEKEVYNPYLGYVKTMLNVNQSADNPLLFGLNKIADSAFSRALQPIQDAFRESKSPADLDAINNSLQSVGLRPAFYDAATNMLANHSAPKGALATFVRRASAILGSLTLGMDPMNAVNNFVGSTVLLGKETKYLLDGIRAGDPAVAGKLAGLSRVTLPGTTDSILSPAKLIAEAHAFKFRPGDKGQLLAQFKAAGYITNLHDQQLSVLDQLSLTGTETISSLEARISKAQLIAKELAKTGQKATGNRWVEEDNRFVAAYIPWRLSQLAVQSGLIGADEVSPYINTFINRTQGNFLASQRPLLFQGPIGQAVGLFQTYQFNLMQQLFRHVGEGETKDAAMLLGLQGTIFGLNGLPAFNYLNTHIVGNASGNTNHRDLYTATYGIFGQTAGDWLLYGAPSNLLASNLYVRGDINPRSPTVIPTSPADVPIISAGVRFFGAMKQVSDRIGAGAPIWESFLQGIEHQGLSRPLAGLAQDLEAATHGYTAFSTDTRGNILGANDLFSIASIARLGGARPFDEAVVADAAYRTAVYRAFDDDRKENLRQAIGVASSGGTQVSPQEMQTFLSQYTQLGGNQKSFNRYLLNRIIASSTPAAEKIIQQVKSPFSQNMQLIMGGRQITGGIGKPTAAVDQSEAEVQR